MAPMPMRDSAWGPWGIVPMKRHPEMQANSSLSKAFHGLSTEMTNPFLIPSLISKPSDGLSAS